MSVVDDIKDQIDIVDLVSETVKLRRTGKNYIGFCPFHANTHTPAFVVFPDSGTWRCFGQCAEGGDIFNYVMRRDGCDFQQALETLAKRAGVELTQQAKDDKPRQEKLFLHQMMEEAILYYHNNLTQTPAGKPALDFLTQRGIKPETIEKFRLGFAMRSWDTLTQHLLSKGYTRKNLLDGGLISEQRDDKGNVIPDGRFYDRFRNRVMIPIRDSRGDAIGFGARILDPNDSPKFLNSPQTVLFDKGRTLFALSEARRSIREKDQVVLVEGYMDVIVLHQEGFTNTVSPMGTALTDHQARQLTRQTKRIVLALDADAAGDHGALRGIDVLRSVLTGNNTENGGKSLLQTESKLNADIRVTRIPDGMDPDEVVLRDPKEWEEILNQAKPIVTHMMETVAKGKNLNDAKVKAEIADTILPLIREIPNLIERETYRQQLAQFLKIDESLLTYTAPAVPANGSKRAFPEKPRLRKTTNTIIFDPRDSIQNKEMEILRLLYLYYDTPGSLAEIDRNLRSFRLPPISSEDFEQSDLHEIAACYFSALDQDEEMDTHKFIEETLSPAVRDTLNNIKKTRGTDPQNTRDLNDELTRSLAYLRQEKCEYLKRNMQEMFLDNQNSETEQQAFEQVMQDSIRQRMLLDMLIESLTRLDLRKRM